MADIDQEQEQKGGGLGGVATGAVLGATGAGATAHFMVKPEGVKKELETAKTEQAGKDSAYKTVSTELQTKNPTEHANFVKAKGEIEGTEARLQAEISNRWHDNLKNNTQIKPEEVKEIRLKGLEAQKKALAELPQDAMSAEAREVAGKGIEAQITAVKAAENNHAALDAALGEGWKKAAEAERTAAVGKGGDAVAKFDAALEEANRTMGPKVIQTKSVNEAFAAAAKGHKNEVVKGLEASIAKETPVAEAQSLATAAVTNGKQHIDKWAELEKGISKQKTEKEAADKVVGGLEKRLAVAEEKGTVQFFTKPFKLMKHGSGKQKLAIAAASVALLAAGYMGVKAMRNRDKGETSYADQITQERAAAAATLPDQGAARA